MQDYELPRTSAPTSLPPSIGGAINRIMGIVEVSKAHLVDLRSISDKLVGPLVQSEVPGPENKNPETSLLVQIHWLIAEVEAYQCETSRYVDNLRTSLE